MTIRILVAKVWILVSIQYLTTYVIDRWFCILNYKNILPQDCKSFESKMYLIEAIINNMAAILNFPCFNLLCSQIYLWLKRLEHLKLLRCCMSATLRLFYRIAPLIFSRPLLSAFFPLWNLTDKGWWFRVQRQLWGGPVLCCQRQLPGFAHQQHGQFWETMLEMNPHICTLESHCYRMLLFLVNIKTSHVCDQVNGSFLQP